MDGYSASALQDGTGFEALPGVALCACCTFSGVLMLPMETFAYGIRRM